MRVPLPPIAAVISFINCINRTDLDGLCALMHVDHQLRLFDEAPVVGRDLNRSAWQGYFEGWPNYVIYPQAITERGYKVAVLGYTTGSHLELPDEVESQETLIWTALVRDGELLTWALLEDTLENRVDHGLPTWSG